MTDERFDFEAAERHGWVVEEADAGSRLDQYLVPRLTPFSRARVQRLIRHGAVTVNDGAARASLKLRAGDRVAADVPGLVPVTVEPQDLPLTVLWEDESAIVIDKAPGMASHPGTGRPDGTVANAVAFRVGMVGPADRPGIVHRLDLDTSGVMVVARTETAHAALSDAFRERLVEKTYQAIVHGSLRFDEDVIDVPLGRSLRDPKKQAVRHDQGRAAETRVSVVERFSLATHVECRPKTGRTHQIRVHLHSRGHPLLGDATYGRRKSPVEVPRLMLHASRLAFPHPVTGATITVDAPLPADFRAVLDRLRALDGAS